MAYQTSGYHMSVRLTDEGGIGICAHESEADALAGSNPRIVICLMPNDANHLIMMMLMRLGQLERAKGPRVTA